MDGMCIRVYPMEEIGREAGLSRGRIPAGMLARGALEFVLAPQELSCIAKWPRLYTRVSMCQRMWDLGQGGSLWLRSSLKGLINGCRPFAHNIPRSWSKSSFLKGTLGQGISESITGSEFYVSKYKNGIVWDILICFYFTFGVCLLDLPTLTAVDLVNINFLFCISFFVIEWTLLVLYQ